jgi:hypothetical protein
MVMVILIYDELYEPEDNKYELKTGKTGLNPDRGRVGVVYVEINYLGRIVW